ncbi:MAG TPA: ammonium transporter [Micropepsaceae bacterium]|jgi:Amt family ammonium transporter|nr:ammonium transporter [Micropepsaceae bacterium]
MINGADTAWMLTSTVLVLFMTLPGLALFYAGLVRAKNVLSVLMHCVAIACLVSVLWFAGAYSLAFVGTNPWIGDLSQALLAGVARGAVHPGTTIPDTVYIMFQMTFAIITPALMIGAYVERIKFGAVLLFSGLWLIVVYAPVAHWVWGGGWLAAMGVKDFAGGIVVHTTAGISALVVAIALGKREGFPHGLQPPHAPWIVMVGAAMLWVGWFGFNAGSALTAGADAGMAMLVTHMAAAVASLTWMAIEWVRFRKPSLIGTVTGTIAGLATITPASGYVGPMGAIIIGIVSGALCYAMVQVVKLRFVVDDSLDVFAVHGVGGMTGTLLTAILMAVEFGGVGYGDGVSMTSQFGVQATGVATAAVWSGGMSFVLIKITEALVGLRVGQESETQGLDLTAHGEAGYNVAFGGTSQ